MNRQIEMEKDMSLREYRWSCNYLNILECKLFKDSSGIVEGYASNYLNILECKCWRQLVLICVKKE